MKKLVILLTLVLALGYSLVWAQSRVGFRPTEETETDNGFGVEDGNIVRELGNDLAATAISGDDLVFLGELADYSITVYNNGTNAQANYTVKLMSVNSTEPLAVLNIADEPLPSGESVTHNLSWNPTIIRTYHIYGLVELAGDQNSSNNQTVSMSTSIYPLDAYMAFVGDMDTASTTNELPVNLSSKNSVAETIYTSTDLNITSGTIRAIIYGNSFESEITKPVQVWMQNTEESDLTTGWLNPAAYTLVFSGNVHFSAGDGFVNIPLDTPFTYRGGNLAVRIYHVWQDQQWSDLNLFYHNDSTDEYPNRSRYYSENGNTPLDPINIPSIGTLSIMIPNTNFVMYPLDSEQHMDTPVVTISNVGTDVLLDWPDNPAAYIFNVYATDDPYNWPVNPVAQVTINRYRTASNDKGFFKVKAISSARNQDLGVVVNPNSRANRQVIPVK